MWSHSPIVLSELIWVGIMMIPLLIFSLRYAHARNKLAQMYAYAQAPTTQHFNSFTSFFPKEDEELNKEWDEKLKDAPRWQEVLGIFQNPNDYKKLVHEAMVWKEKNWSSVGVAMTGAPLRVFFINIIFFGFVMYPLILECCGSAIVRFKISDGIPTTNLMGIFTLIFGIIIIARCNRLHRSTLYHQKLIEQVKPIADRTIEDYADVVDNKTVTDSWKCRGFYIQKICEKYFKGSSKALVDYAKDSENIKFQRSAIARNLIDNQLAYWYRKPVTNDMEAEEDDAIGFADTENLMFGMFLLLMVGIAISIIVSLSELANVFTIGFDFLDWIFNIGKHIGGS